MKKIQETLQKLGGFIAVAAAQHLVTKVIDHKNAVRAEAAQEARDKQASELLKATQDIHKAVVDTETQFNSSLNQGSNIPDNFRDIIATKLNHIKKAAEDLAETVNKSLTTIEDQNDLQEGIDNLQRRSQELERFVIENLPNDTQQFTSWLNTFYKYLDSLSILQESAIVHILFFLVLLVTVLNILAVFFSNELILYFNLESKYPSLSTFFKLRAKFQRYYLLWNILILFIFCVFGILINILILY